MPSLSLASWVCEAQLKKASSCDAWMTRDGIVVGLQGQVGPDESRRLHPELNYIPLPLELRLHHNLCICICMPKKRSTGQKAPRSFLVK